MIVLRCTQKLLSKVKPTLIATPLGRESSGMLGDWYCHYVQHGRAHLVLCVCERSLLPMVIPAAPARHFPLRLAETLAQMLARMNIASNKIEREVAAMRTVVFAATASRVVLGSLNDFNYALSFYDDEIQMGAFVPLSLHLAETPCKPIAYQSPIEVVQTLFVNSI